MIGCSPNLVVGTREPDAATVDAAEPVPQPDAGSASEMPAPSPDAGRIEDAATPPAPDVDANVNNDMQNDGGAVCTTSAECTDVDEPYCVVAEGRCVECLSDDNCDPSQLCEADGECSTRPIPCTSVLQCAGNEDPVCHSTLQVCVECESDSDCPRTETCRADNECD
jgi:hypothetical protein